jgi:GNAT superfamily N-acetyltransferase
MKLLQFFEAVNEKFGKSVVWDNGQFFIAVNNPDKPTFFTAWTQDNEKVATLSTKVMPKNGEQWMAVDYVEVDPASQRQGIARALYHVMINGMSTEYAGLFGYGPDIASQHVSKIYQRYGAHEQEDGHFYIPNPNRGVTEDEKLNLPDLETGDELMVGKFKNRKATIKGFTKDKHNQPIAKTNKGDQQIFKGRVKKLMDESQSFDRTTTEMGPYDELINATGDERMTDYFRQEKGKEWRMVDISPDEYLDAVDRSFVHGVMDGIEDEKVQRYIRKLKAGETFPALTLDFSRGDYLSQEGRHRSLAAKAVGIKSVPVLVVTATPEEAKYRGIRVPNPEFLKTMKRQPS